jgi:hypothetical protein
VEGSWRIANRTINPNAAGEAGSGEGGNLMRVLDEHFQRPLVNYTFEDCLDPDKMALIIKQSIKASAEAAMPQVEALMAAGWTFEIVSTSATEPWQWAWRRPPRRKNSPGMRFASTNQAFNALMREDR